MWEKILAQLAAKHSGVSKAVLTMIAKKLAEKVTEESGIEGAIIDFEANSTLSIKDYADFVQQEGDKRVGEAQKTWETKNKKTETKTEEEVKKEDPESIPAWAKALQETVTTMGQQLAAKKSESTLEDLVVKAKEKGIPEAYARKTAIGDDFDLDATLSALETEWNGIKQENLNTAVASEKVVAGTKVTGKEVSSAIANFAKANVEAANAANN